MTWSSKQGVPGEGRKGAIKSVRYLEEYLQEKKRWLEEGKIPPEDVAYEREQLRKSEEHLKELKKDYNIQ